MTLSSSFVDPTFRIYLALAQYPVLQVWIRAKMWEELFNRGVISSAEFNDQVREQAIESQTREGLTDSFGTHFFQDLLEAEIYPLAIYLDDEEVIFNREFFYNSSNHLLDFLPEDAKFKGSLRLVQVEDYRAGHLLNLVMDSEVGRAVAYLVSNKEVA